MKQKTKIIIIRTLLLTLTVFVVCFIFFQSALPGEASSNESSMVLNFLNGLLQSAGLDIVLTHSFVRTAAHFLEFACFAGLLFLTLLSFAQKPLKSALIALPSTFFLAICDETIQLFSKERAFQITDILVDTSGGLTAILLIGIITYAIFAFKRKGSENH